MRNLLLFLSLIISPVLFAADSADGHEKHDSKDNDVRSKKHRTETVSLAADTIPKEFYCCCEQIFLYPVKLACGHIFCRACIQRILWRTDVCPHCKAEIKFTTHYNADDEMMRKMLDFNRTMVINRIIESSPDENSLANLIEFCKEHKIDGIYDRRWTYTFLGLGGELPLRFTYRPNLNSLMLYVSIAKIPNRVLRLRLLEKFLAKSLIISSDKEHCTAGLTTGQPYVILRRSLDMMDAKKDALKISCQSFIPLVKKYQQALLTSSTGDFSQLKVKQLKTYTIDEIMCLGDKDPTYLALSNIAKADQSMFPKGWQTRYDKHHGELVCVCPFFTLPTEETERHDKLEKFCEKILPGTEGFFLKGDVLYHVTREPVRVNTMVDPSALMKKLINGPLKNFENRRELLDPTPPPPRKDL